MNQLADKTILITRAAHQADELVTLIEQHGGTPIVFPTIDIIPPATWDQVDRAVDSLYIYDGLIFTSTNGVEFFFERMDERGSSADELKSKTICVVGEKTKRAVEAHGLSVTTMPEKFTSLELASKLRQDDLRGKTFLFPKGNLAKDTLPEVLKSLGAAIDSVIVYQTTKPKCENIDPIRKKLLDGRIDVVTFTSPSTFKNFAALFTQSELKDIQHKTKFAVIGPVTAKAVEEAGLDVDIAPKESTIELLVEAIVECLR